MKRINTCFLSLFFAAACVAEAPPASGPEEEKNTTEPNQPMGPMMPIEPMMPGETLAPPATVK